MINVRRGRTLSHIAYFRCSHRLSLPFVAANADRAIRLAVAQGTTEEVRTARVERPHLRDDAAHTSPRLASFFLSRRRETSWRPRWPRWEVTTLWC